ncbi:MAG: chemotaxis protein CheW [Candidatus Gastranaerophilales bacterium]|nr:chemotaxis protein CheW [Candidatus Gastranaerophilales bacterium]
MDNTFFLTQDNEILPEFLIAFVNDQGYAFDIKFLVKIIQLPSFAAIEKTPPNAAGIINLHGENIAAYDLKTCLGLEQKEFSASQQVLVFNVNEKKFAIIVDKTGDIITANISTSKAIAYNSVNKFLSAGLEINQAQIILVDIEKFINQFDNLEYSITGISDIKPPSSCNAVVKLEERAVILQEKQETALNIDYENIEKFLIFSLNDEYYCFSLRYVKKIKTTTDKSITIIPCTPPYIKGIINFRGDYVCLIDIKSFLNIGNDKPKNKLTVIIINIDKYKLAMIVDNIVDITNLPFEMVKPKDDDSGFIIGELYNNEDKRLINILNVEKLFSSENINIEDY